MATLSYYARDGTCRTGIGMTRCPIFLRYVTLWLLPNSLYKIHTSFVILLLDTSICFHYFVLARVLKPFRQHRLSNFAAELTSPPYNSISNPWLYDCAPEINGDNKTCDELIKNYRRNTLCIDTSRENRKGCERCTQYTVICHRRIES